MEFKFVKMRDGKKVAVIEFGNHEAELTAAQIEELIRKLSAVRKDMEPYVPTDPGGNVTAVGEAGFSWQPSPRGGMVVAARHPGIGWLYFHMTSAVAGLMWPDLRDCPKPPSAPPAH